MHGHGVERGHSLISVHVHELAAEEIPQSGEARDLNVPLGVDVRGDRIVMVTEEVGDVGDLITGRDKCLLLSIRTIQKFSHPLRIKQKTD